MFGLENPLDSPSSPPPFFTKRSLLLANARSGIRLVVEMLLAPTVWVPSYLCACIIEAIKGTKAKIKFYEVDDSLALSSREWLDEVQRGDLVLVIGEQLRLAEILNQPCKVGLRGLRIGVVLRLIIPQPIGDVIDPMRLLADAEIAVDRAKELGRNRVQRLDGYSAAQRPGTRPPHG